MRRVSWNLANCHATVRKLLVQVLTKSTLWSWRTSCPQVQRLMSVDCARWTLQLHAHVRALSRRVMTISNDLVSVRPSVCLSVCPIMLMLVRVMTMMPVWCSEQVHARANRVSTAHAWWRRYMLAMSRDTVVRNLLSQITSVLLMRSSHRPSGSYETLRVGRCEQRETFIREKRRL